jgi:hypothetical protein
VNRFGRDEASTRRTAQREAVASVYDLGFRFHWFRQYRGDHCGKECNHCYCNAPIADETNTHSCPVHALLGVSGVVSTEYIARVNDYAIEVYSM